MQDAVERRCRAIGRRVDVVVNYDGFEILEPAVGPYAQVVEHMVREHYAHVTRYTTSTFPARQAGCGDPRPRAGAAHLRDGAPEAEAPPLTRVAAPAGPPPSGSALSSAMPGMPR